MTKETGKVHAFLSFCCSYFPFPLLLVLLQSISLGSMKTELNSKWSMRVNMALSSEDWSSRSASGSGGCDRGSSAGQCLNARWRRSATQQKMNLRSKRRRKSSPKNGRYDDSKRKTTKSEWATSETADCGRITRHEIDSNTSSTVQSTGRHAKNNHCQTRAFISKLVQTQRAQRYPIPRYDCHSGIDPVRRPAKLTDNWNEWMQSRCQLPSPLARVIKRLASARKRSTKACPVSQRW